ncbi:MAG TPA: GNAT family N-acetyltransferase [Candidatus Acidoferrales bacterium]|nr:GNAT family N-acetyltransferase [Candidatus Acidoferrales bacterium]
MNAAISVRTGDERDRSFILDLGDRTVMDSVSSLRDAIPGMARVSFERLVDFVYTQPHVILIAEDGGERRGFLLLLDAMPDEVTLGPQAFVAYMAVEPEARRAGVATALLAEAEKIARDRKLPCIAMMVTEENDAARRVYERAGFVTERRLLCKTL